MKGLGPNPRPMPGGMSLVVTLVMALSACAQAVDDGLIDIPDQGNIVLPDAGVDPNTPSRASRAFVRAGGDGVVVNLGTGEARVVCPAAEPRPTPAGDRVLCVPDRTADPLTVVDPETGDAVSEIETWFDDADGGPHISPNGNRIAVVSVNEDNEEVVAIYTMNGALFDEVPGRGLIGFADNETAVIRRNGLFLWRQGDEPIELPGNSAFPVGPAPAGAVYGQTREDALIFVDVETGMSRTVGEGRPQSVRRTSVVTQKIDSSVYLVDVSSGASMDLEIARPPFDRRVRVKIVGPGAVQITTEPVTGCGALETTVWSAEDRRKGVVSTTEGHVASVNMAGNAALVFVLGGDDCAPTGVGSLTAVGGGTPTDLQGFAGGPVRGGEISEDGAHLALYGDDAVFIVDRLGDRVFTVDGAPDSFAAFR